MLSDKFIPPGEYYEAHPKTLPNTIILDMVKIKVASDALGNLTRDVGMGIEEGTVAALISRSLEGPGDMDADDDVMGSSYVAPGVSPPCIGGHGPGGGSSVQDASYEV